MCVLSVCIMSTKFKPQSHCREMCPHLIRVWNKDLFFHVHFTLVSFCAYSERWMTSKSHVQKIIMQQLILVLRNTCHLWIIKLQYRSKILWNRLNTNRKKTKYKYKSSAVAEIGDRGHNRHRPKRRGLLCPFRAELRPRLIQCGLGRGLLPYQVASSSIHSFGQPQRTLDKNWVGCAL